VTGVIVIGVGEISRDTRVVGFDEGRWVYLYSSTIDM